MFTCLELGRAEEGVMAAERAIALNPSDAGLYANEALAYLIAGRNADALKSVEESLRLDPKDEISQSVKRMIEEVMSGKRPQPKKMSDIDR
jgi:tetratricopeptide (TPR) repeat protein